MCAASSTSPSSASAASQRRRPCSPRLKRGIVDLIGAARPSIADPFLPKKIAEGRPDDIRECIGCNICYASDIQGVPLRCTQNPTMGEEWRRDWHPDRIARAKNPERVLVVAPARPASKPR